MSKLLVFSDMGGLGNYVGGLSFEARKLSRTRMGFE